jgi:hypothetical protein
MQNAIIGKTYLPSLISLDPRDQAYEIVALYIRRRAAVMRFFKLVEIH